MAKTSESDVPRLSVVIPVYNEEGSLLPLYRELVEVLQAESYELIFVDDGSSDSSGRVIEELSDHDEHVRSFHFGRNFGKSQALAAGFQQTRGRIIVTMDADLQDDPREMPRLLEGIADGYDLVSGWKLERHDPVTKVWPSRVFNWLCSRLTGLPLHDLNCGYKAYRRRVIENVDVYGEQHRFIPVLAHWQGFRVTEVAIRHRPRQFGRSKFGIMRFLAGFMDLLTVLFLTRFNRKPLHVFGSVGLICFMVGLAISAYLTFVKIVLGEPIGTRPLLLLGVLLLLMGMQFTSMGLLGEMLTSYAGRARDARFYRFRSPHSRPAEEPADEPPVVAREGGRAGR